MKIVVFPATNADGKLADVELRFETIGAPLQIDAPTWAGVNALAGLTLVGFSVWQNKAGIKSVKFPARAYTRAGQKRVFTLLRPTETPGATQALVSAILQEYEAQMAVEKA